jgi:hypothetical protein
MTTEPEAAPDDAARRRRIVQILLAGLAVATLLTVGVGLAGADGRAGAAVWMLVMAATSGVGALYGVVTALVDDLKDRQVSRARIAWMVGLFFAAAALMAMVAGVGG